MLAAVGVLSAADLTAIERGLVTIRGEIERGEFAWSRDFEDVHLNIEHRLTVLVGEPGKRLHTARSRNDQVATDLRLWLRGEIDALVRAIAGLRRAFLDLAERHIDTIMIGNYYYGTGRRKSAVARVFLKKGNGAIVVNDKPADEFFSRDTGRMVIRQPLKLTNHEATFDIMMASLVRSGLRVFSRGRTRSTASFRSPASADRSRPAPAALSHR